MKVSGSPVKRGHRFAIFWGGGLGDVLSLRPLLMGLEATLDTRACFFTTATHLPGIFSELGLAAEVRILPSKPAEAVRLLQGLGVRFDWLYLGPYPRIRTRLLAHAARPRRIWSVRHADASPFIAEQVLADIRALGFEGPEGLQQPYGGRWAYPAAGRNAPAHDYLALHPGAKDAWETTRWPDELWAAFLPQLLRITSLDLVLVGLPSERDRLERLLRSLAGGERSRVHIKTDLQLVQLAGVIDCAAGVVCHNSGVLHLAAMLGKPTVALTGSSANFWRPPYPHVVNLTSGACNLACNQYRCPVPFYRARCIRGLDVETVLGAVREHVPGCA